MPIRAVTKNKQSRGSESIFVTNEYLCPKCYLKLFKIVPVKMGSFNRSYAKVTP
jgi:hypothetical protein